MVALGGAVAVRLRNGAWTTRLRRVVLATRCDGSNTKRADCTAKAAGREQIELRRTVTDE